MTPLRTFYIRKDAVALLNDMEAESVDLVITDPAYESLEKHRGKGTTTRLKVSDGSSNKWFDIFPNDRFEEFFAATYRVLKKNRHFYMMCDEETADYVKPIGSAAGFKFWKSIIWDKVNIGMGYHYRQRHEFVLFFEKGKRKLNDLGVPSILDIKKVHRGYPTEKPVELYEVLIAQSTQVGELVVDPFMGSGNGAVAARNMQCHFYGGDSSPASLLAAGIRLQKRDEEFQKMLEQAQRIAG